MAVAAGLLHDIGMLHVDPQILDPDTALTPRQRRQWHPHPLVSTAMVARHDVYPPTPR
jgi:HD-GYP domain-containing protein (c-di-GMP phosphodiesterase class II)